MKKSLVDYSRESRIMRIRIEYDGEKFMFNLGEEVRIDENTIQRQLQDQPSSYAFLGLLHKKLIRKVKESEANLHDVFAKTFVVIKDQTNPDTGKPFSDELARQMVLEEKAYTEARNALIKAEEEASLIQVSLSAFEMRSNLIQTLSANLRKKD